MIAYQLRVIIILIQLNRRVTVKHGLHHPLCQLQQIKINHQIRNLPWMR